METHIEQQEGPRWSFLAIVIPCQKFSYPVGQQDSSNYQVELTKKIPKVNQAGY